MPKAVVALSKRVYGLRAPILGIVLHPQFVKCAVDETKWPNSCMSTYEQPIKPSGYVKIIQGL